MTKSKDFVFMIFIGDKIACRYSIWMAEFLEK